MRRPLLLALVATLVTRLALVSLVRVAPAWDGFFYARLASSLASGAGYAVVDAPGLAPRATAFYPVGYPWAMAALLPLTGDARLAAVAVNLLAALLAAAAVVAVAHRAAGARAATLAGLAYALLPGAALWCAAAMTETLTGALLALALALTVVPRSARAGAAGAFGAGVALGVATLVRPQSLLLLPLTALASRGWRARALALALALAGAAAAVAPWTARNCARLDACALVSTNGGSNLLIGTFPEARGGYRRPTEDDGCRGVRGEVHRDRCMTGLARERIRAAPWTWLALGAFKVAVTFAWEHDPVSYARAEARRWTPAAVAATALCTAGWWLLVALAWRAASRAHGRSPSTVATLQWGVGAFATVAFTHAVFLGADRYHLILAPLLCPAAGVALARVGAPAEASVGG